MSLQAEIDSPLRNSLNDPLALRVEGWFWASDRSADVVAIEVLANDAVVGEARLFFRRPDVEAALSCTDPAPIGFALLAHAPSLFAQAHARLECRARFGDGSASSKFGARDIRLIPHDHRENHYGVLARSDETRLFHRSDIYTSGASVSEINPECLTLLRRYLGAPPHRVIDVGCGFGGYGRALLDAGYDWLGVEVKKSDCDELARRNLPHRHVDGRTLPFEDGGFDHAICVEVLEHIPDPAAFLAEVRRVIQRRLLISVPNLELIPYLHRYGVVPWHLLEGDHKNFFTRPSLRELLRLHFSRVDVISYGPIPLRTPEGLPLHNHLFAICEV